MKRTPLNRGSSQLQRSPLRRSSLPAGSAFRRSPGPPRTAPIKSRSAKRVRWMRQERVPFVVALLEQRPWCEIAQEGVCTGRSVDVDEIRLRSQGGSATDPENCLAVCRECHDWKHNNPDAAEAAGVYKRRGAA